MPVMTAKSGRALAQERRNTQAKAGRSSAPAQALGRQRSTSQAAPQAFTSAALSTPVEHLCQRLDNGEAFGAETQNVRELCRLRRQAVSQNGKTAVKKPQRPIEASDFHDAPSHTQANLDDFCQQAEAQSKAFASQDLQDVRHFCRQRRQALAQNGKAALPAKAQASSGNQQFASQKHSSARMGMMQGSYCAPQDQSCREQAKQVRQSRALSGRETGSNTRPNGRVRPKSPEVPEKVEVGTTLSGQFVTGTQVERTEKVTGTERGACRNHVTGTEYLGQEQFQRFCEQKPPANPAKVRHSQTSLGQSVSGTEVIPAKVTVTGGESGSCRAITGTEYLGSERFQQFCEGRGFLPRIEKVIESQSPRQAQKITGSDEARTRPISGVAAGFAREITGTQYADMHRARLTIHGVEKVQITHTLGGRSVSGGVVDRSSKVTGNETGSCRGITGTEYLSNEHYQAFCETLPKASPHRVSVMPTRYGQAVSGVSVERSEKVTGNEPGSCANVTGSQYSETPLCDRRSAKSHNMKTLAGREVSGTTVASRPKLTGDARGGCLPVTGNEYYGQEHYAACPSTPMPRPEKVGISHTKTGQAVTGAMLEKSALVTGNAAGSQRRISGTPYGAVALEAKAPTPEAAILVEKMPETLPKKRLEIPQIEIQQVPPRKIQEKKEVSLETLKAVVTPQAKGLVQEALVQETNETAQTASAANAFGQLSYASSTASQHLLTPELAKGHWQRAPARITGSSFAAAEKITGPINLASGLVSGTPEFRYRQDRPLPTPLPVASWQAQAETLQPSEVVWGKMATSQAKSGHPAAEQVTGEGRTASNENRITGDNWGRNSRVTGTEGRWSQGRNPTYRSATLVREIPAVGAFANKSREKTAPQTNPKITGSSAGDSSKGPVITLSGGARG